MLWAGNSLDKAHEIFDAEVKRRPRIRLTIRQRTRGAATLAADMKRAPRRAATANCYAASGGTLAALDVDIVGADFFQRQANEFAVSLNRRPVIKFVAHGLALAQ